MSLPAIPMNPETSAASVDEGRRGAISVLVCLLIVVFLASVVLSVDVAYMQLCRTRLRSATDAAARAAGEALSREQDLDASRQAAKDIAQANLVAGEPLVLDDSDIVFGHSDQQQSGAWDFDPEGEPINAVRVNGRRTRTSPSGSINTLFGRFFNVFDFEPTQLATVVRLDRDICLVVDRSSSMKLYLTDTAPTMSTSDSRFCQPPNMSLTRWGALSVAFDAFVDALDTTPQHEFVGLVSYASDYSACSHTNHAADINQVLSENHSDAVAAMAAISNSKFNGATDISAGILKGIQVLTDPDHARPFAAKTMVLMTDGFYTVGTAPHLVAPQAAANDIVIHVVTFGADTDEDEMRAVADATGGNYYHAPDAQALRDAFEEIALTLPVMFTD
jgi:Ca-activated chloride channel homolog